MSERHDVPEMVQHLVALLTSNHSDLAREAKVTYGTLYSWSVGRRNPSLQNAMRLGEVAEKRAALLHEAAALLREAAERNGDGESTINGSRTRAFAPGRSRRRGLTRSRSATS